MTIESLGPGHAHFKALVLSWSWIYVVGGAFYLLRTVCIIKDGTLFDSDSHVYYGRVLDHA